MRILESKFFGYDENGQPLNYIVASGDSSETEPTTGIVDGSRLFETDTGWYKVFNEKSGTWRKMFCIKAEE